MHQHRQLDTERAPDTVLYHRSDCMDHPCPEQPYLQPADELHLTCRNVVINGDPVAVRDLFDEVTPDHCSCGAPVASDSHVFEWPPVPITGEAALDMFRRTDGHVVLRVNALNYPAEPVDWQSLLGRDDPVRERDWMAGLVDGHLVTRTRIDHEPIWEATAVSPSEFGVLLRKLPSRPKPIYVSELEGVLEDYQSGHEITTGIEL